MSNRVFTQTFGAVGTILEGDGKILLVKEAGGRDKGKWSHPAGWIDVGVETAFMANESFTRKGLPRRWQNK